MKSEQLFEKSKKYVPGGVHSPVRSFKGLHTTPRFVQRAEGAYLYDEDGKEYIDFCMSFGPLIVGHRDPIVEEVVKSALTRGWSYGACEKYSLELAEFIVEKIPFIDQIRFVNSGTEAVMTAIRLARGFTGKNKIIKFNGCYHGHTDAMLIKAGSGLAGTSEASSAGVTHNMAEDTLICELNDRRALEDIFNEFGNDVAALIIEPLPANNGLLVQDQTYLEFVREITKKYNTLLIFDEVISGFRVAFGGMAELTKITPDIVTYGKIIGGGFPVGAVAARHEIMQCLAPIGKVYQAGTLSANPVAMASGLATLKQLTPKAYQELADSTRTVVQMLGEWAKSHQFAQYKMVSHSSLFWATPCDHSIKNITQLPENLSSDFYYLFQALLEKGIYLAPNAYEVGFVSLAHNERVIQDLKQRLWP